MLYDGERKRKAFFRFGWFFICVKRQDGSAYLITMEDAGTAHLRRQLGWTSREGARWQRWACLRNLEVQTKKACWLAQQTSWWRQRRVRWFRQRPR